LITALPDNVTSEELRAGGRAMEKAALAIGIRYEADPPGALPAPPPKPRTGFSP
jgi:hypothetical protein